jgi:hypothetical protein
MAMIGKSRAASGAPAGRRPQESRRRATAVLTAAVLGIVLPLATLARAQSPMIQGWLFANAACKSGRSDDPKTQQACETRDRLGGKLKRRGCVYHEDGDWWKCRR